MPNGGWWSFLATAPGLGWACRSNGPGTRPMRRASPRRGALSPSCRQVRPASGQPAARCVAPGRSGDGFAPAGRAGWSHELAWSGLTRDLCRLPIARNGTTTALGVWGSASAQWHWWHLTPRDGGRGRLRACPKPAGSCAARSCSRSRAQPKLRHDNLIEIVRHLRLRSAQGSDHCADGIRYLSVPIQCISGRGSGVALPARIAKFMGRTDLVHGAWTSSC